MKDALADVQGFCEAHGLDVRQGTIASVFASESQDDLARRIADLAPSHLVSEPYDGVQTELLPMPCLVVCNDGAIVTIRSARRDWVILSGAGFNSRQRVRKVDFEVRFQPQTIITYRGFTSHEFTWHDYLRGFSLANFGRLTVSFFGNLIGSLASLAMPIGALLIIDKVLGHNGVGTLDTIIILVILAEVLRYFVTVSVNVVQGEVAEEFMEETRSLVFDVTRNSYRPQSPPTSHALYNALGHIEKTRKIFTQYSVNLLAEIVFLMVLVALMFALSPLLAKIALFGVAISIVVTLSVGLLRNTAKARRFDVSESNNKLFVRLLSSIGDRRVMGRDHNSARSWSENADAITQFDLASTEYKFDSAPINNFILNVLRAGIMWFGAVEVLNGLMSLGQFVAFNLIVALALGPVKSMASFVSNWTMLNRSAVALQTMLRRSLEQAEKRTFRLPPTGSLGVLQLSDVALSGKKDAPPIALGINLTVNEGDKIAILGASGAGKSTLINALSGIGELYSGSITLNGVELEDYSLSAYRRRLGILSQSARLSDGTVLENMVLGENDIDMDRVKQSLEQALVADVVNDLDEGLDEQIGHETRKLSQGQKQRLMLARALLHGQELLLLDEPTSALDQGTELAVGENLVRADEPRTIIAATHSLGLAALFDRVLMFKDKKLVDVTQTIKTTSVTRQASALRPTANIPTAVITR